MAPRKSGTKRAAVHSEPEEEEEDSNDDRSQAEEDSQAEESDEGTAKKKKKQKGTTAANKKKQTKAKAVDKDKGKKGKGKGKKKAVATDDEEEDEEEEDEEENDGKKKKKKGGALNDDLKESLVQDLTRHVLFCESQRKPFKREDVTKTILGGGLGKHFPLLLPLVQKRLQENFGFELVLLRQKDQAAAKNPAKVYFVRSSLPSQLLRSLATEINPFFFPSKPKNRNGRDGEGVVEEEEADEPREKKVRAWQEESGIIRDGKKEDGGEYGLLGVILALILVSGKVLGDDQLHSYLKRLGLTSDTLIPHSLSCNPSHTSQNLTQFLALLNKQTYLEKEKSKTAGPAPAAAAGKDKKGKGGDPTVLWKWGARAEAEIGEIGVAKFVQEVYEWKDPKIGGEGDGEAIRKKKGDTGEKLLMEIARAADVPELRGTDAGIEMVV